MKRLKLGIVVVLSLILILIVVQNTASVQAHFLGFTTEMSLVVLLFLTGAMGFVAGLMLGFYLKGRDKKSIKEQGTN